MLLVRDAQESRRYRTFVDQTPQAARAVPLMVYDKSLEHRDSLPWREEAHGVLRARGFNQGFGARKNHAGMDVTYRLEGPGAIVYKYKVEGVGDGGEPFDRYWYLKGPDGLFLSGVDFCAEQEEFCTHAIEDLPAGTYELTLGMFCPCENGEVVVDVCPCEE